MSGSEMEVAVHKDKHKTDFYDEVMFWCLIVSIIVQMSHPVRRSSVPSGLIENVVVGV